MSPLAAQAQRLGRALKAQADALDAAWLKTADPRAVQGGAICEEASGYRDLARTAYRLCTQIQEHEEN